jgi:hypothetical protein
MDTAFTTDSISVFTKLSAIFSFSTGAAADIPESNAMQKNKTAQDIADRI